MIAHTCKDCPDRHVACHCECEKYQAYHAQQVEDYKRRVEAIRSSPCTSEDKKANARKRAHDQLRGRRVVNR